MTSAANKKSLLPTIGGGPKRTNPYEIEGPGTAGSKTAESEEPSESDKNYEYWLSNQNFKVRDYQIKDAFIKCEQRMESKSRIDAMLSGTTCVVTFFNHDMILCANSGDSRAILISENENK